MTIKVHVDRDVCVGAGQCMLAAPDVFDQDDDGIVVLLQGDEPTAEPVSLRNAALNCPSRAVTLSE